MELTSKTIETLKAEESVGTNSVSIYHENYFAVFNLDDYALIVVDLKLHARDRLKSWIERKKKMLNPTG